MIEIENIKAVIFDLDGTLYDNRRLPVKLCLADVPNMWILGAERKARKALMGIDYQNAGGVYDALFAKMSEVKQKGCKWIPWFKVGLTADEASRWYHEIYMPLQVAVLGMYYVIRPLTVELLEALRARNIRVILYSDYGHEVEKLRALGIPEELFDGIVSAAKMGGLKPSQASMRRLFEKYELDPKTTLYVGDREDTDGDSARPMGVPFHNVKLEAGAWDELLKAFL